MERPTLYLPLDRGLGGGTPRTEPATVPGPPQRFRGTTLGTGAPGLGGRGDEDRPKGDGRDDRGRGLGGPRMESESDLELRLLCLGSLVLTDRPSVPCASGRPAPSRPDHRCTPPIKIGDRRPAPLPVRHSRPDHPLPHSTAEEPLTIESFG